jgi:HSP20 family molecular chaperone IbpA
LSMPQVGFPTEESKPELQRATRAKLSNSTMKVARALWRPFRKLIAELRAFPTTSMRIDGGLVVKAQLPGLQRDEVRVELTEDMLVIDAEPSTERNEPFLIVGRRLIPLPKGVDVGAAKAELKNGVLIVLLTTPYAKNMRRHVPVECSDDSLLNIESR